MPKSKKRVTYAFFEVHWSGVVDGPWDEWLTHWGQDGWSVAYVWAGDEGRDQTNRYVTFQREVVL